VEETEGATDGEAEGGIRVDSMDARKHKRLTAARSNAGNVRERDRDGVTKTRTWMWEPRGAAIPNRVPRIGIIWIARLARRVKHRSAMPRAAPAIFPAEFRGEFHGDEDVSGDPERQIAFLQAVCAHVGTFWKKIPSHCSR